MIFAQSGELLGKGKYYKGKGDKGSDKGLVRKGNEKGKPQQSYEKKKFDGYCNQCGKWGHRKSECWNRPVNEVAKPESEAGRSEVSTRTSATSSLSLPSAPVRAVRLEATREEEDKNMFIFAVKKRCTNFFAPS